MGEAFQYALTQQSELFPQLAENIHRIAMVHLKKGSFVTFSFPDYSAEYSLIPYRTVTIKGYLELQDMSSSQMNILVWKELHKGLRVVHSEGDKKDKLDDIIKRYNLVQAKPQIEKKKLFKTLFF